MYKKFDLKKKREPGGSLFNIINCILLDQALTILLTATNAIGAKRRINGKADFVSAPVAVIEQLLLLFFFLSLNAIYTGPSRLPSPGGTNTPINEPSNLEYCKISSVSKLQTNMLAPASKPKSIH